jgi:hypothetical protein
MNTSLCSFFKDMRDFWKVSQCAEWGYEDLEEIYKGKAGWDEIMNYILPPRIKAHFFFLKNLWSELGEINLQHGNRKYNV